MATECPNAYACGTIYPGWLTGTLPGEGNPTTLQVRFRRNSVSNVCSLTSVRVYIEVKNCGPYYIYYLNGQRLRQNCQHRFCGTAD